MSNADTPGQLCRAWARHSSVPEDLLAKAGTTIIGVEERRNAGFAACYRLGEHRVVLADPLLADVLGDLASDTHSASEDEIRQFGSEREWEFVSVGVQKTLAAPMVPSTVLATDPALAGYRVQAMDWSDQAHIAAMQDFIDASSAEDLDDAEVEIDNLEDIAVAIFNPANEVAAYASARSFAFDGFGDIGVMTRSTERRRGLGRAVVSALITDVMPAEWEPMYRHEVDNVGSGRLSAGLGFVVAAELIGIGPTEPG